MYPKDVISDNVYIGNLDVGNESEEEAKAALDEQLEQLKNLQVTMKVDDNSETVTLGELGLQYKDQDKMVEQAFNYGKKGGLLRRYYRLHHLAKTPYTVEMDYTLDTETAKSVIEEKSESLTKHAENATLEVKDDTVKVIDAVDGKTVDVDASLEELLAYLSKEWDQKDISLEMVQITEEPEVTADDLSEMEDVLGTYTTYVGNGDKLTNVTVGTEALNGTILMPGEELAVDGAMGPYDAEHGYTLGNSYAGTTVEETYGGGVCQVSTTLYNAVLYAELEVVERHPHSMLISYVDPSRDAAVATGVLDLIIKNNYDTPIYIAGEVDDDYQLTFSIYGKETRDSGRTIDFESEVLETEDYDVTYEVDSEASLGSMEYSGSPCMGETAQLWKIVYQDGEEVSRDVINSSTYAKSDQIIKVGTACDNSEASALVEAAVATQDSDQITTAIAEASALLY
jgi:vancomycin resistance protein YoaR